MTAKKCYYIKLLLKSNNKSKTTWNIVKTIINNKGPTNNITTMNLKDKLSCNPLAIANAFNTYFSSVAEKLLTKNSFGITIINNKDCLSYLHQNFIKLFSTMKLSNTSTYETEKIIYSMKPKNSHGYDEISLMILKVSATYVLLPLTYIFNKILQTGIFPNRLKFLEVKPLYKKGDIAEFSNYRPISLLPTFSKITEKIIYKRPYLHLNENNVLVTEKFGFREKSSTEMATHILLNNILSSLDKKKCVGGLFCDLQKAFDCVNHNILLAKTEFYGISGIVNKLMRSYLENRYQRFLMKDSTLNKVSSKWELVKHRFPQGSILGSLLFLIYINDFPLSMKKIANPILFADDTSIIISNTNPEEFKSTRNISSVPNEIIIWFNSNFLTLNCDKSHFLQLFLKKA
jgi:hypothetical protein